MAKSKPIKSIFGDLLIEKAEPEMKLTVGEVVKSLLEDLGCPPDVVGPVLADMRSDNVLMLDESWDKEYLPGMKKALYITANTVAVRYLDDNFPDAWFRRSFCNCNACTGQNQHNKGFE